MATSGSRGTTVVGTTTATWSNTGNAVDGSFGDTSTTFATWVNATKKAAGTLTVGGYTFGGVSTANGIVSVAANFKHYETSVTVLPTVTCQLLDSTGVAISTAQTITPSTATTTVQTITFDANPTAAQAAAGLRTQAAVTRAQVTTAATFGLSFVDVTVTYTLPIATLTDDFGSDSGKWTLDAGGSITGGQLQITSNTNWYLAYSDDKFNFVGSSVFLKVTPGAYGTDQRTIVEARVGHPAETNTIGATIENNLLYIHRVVGGTYTNTAGVTYSPTNHQWIRLREASGTMYLDTSANGSSWTNSVQSYSISTLNLGAAQLVLQVYQPSGSSTAYFDNVNTVPAINQDIGGSLAVTASPTGTATTARSVGGSLAVTATPSGAATLNTHQTIGGSLAVTATGSGAAAYGQTLAGSLTVTAAPSGVGAAGQSVDGSLTATTALSGSAAYGQTLAGSLTVTAEGSGAVVEDQGVAGTFTGTADSPGAATLNTHQDIGGALTVTATPAGTVDADRDVSGSLPVVAAPGGAAALGNAASGSLTVVAAPTGAAVADLSVTGSLTVAVTGSGAVDFTSATGAQEIGGALAVTADPSGVGQWGAPIGGSLPVTASPDGVGQWGTTVGGALAVTAATPAIAVGGQVVGGTLNASTGLLGVTVIGRFIAGLLPVAAAGTGDLYYRVLLVVRLDGALPVPSATSTVAVADKRCDLVVPAGRGTVTVAPVTDTVTP